MAVYLARGIPEFLLEFGNADSSETLSDQQIAAYHGKFPDILLKFWKEQGWGGYGEGVFWTVNPADYHEVLQEWLVGTPHENEPDNYVFARTAFGSLFIWNSKKGYMFELSIPYHWLIPGTGGDEMESYELERNIDSFFFTRNKEHFDETDESDKPLFKRALKKLGPLESHEMYGFVPAVSLGGKKLLKNLQKVDILVHLSILAKLKPTEMFNYNNYR